MNATGLATLVAALHDQIKAAHVALLELSRSPIVEHRRGVDDQGEQIKRQIEIWRGLAGRLRPLIGHLKIEAKSARRYAGREDLRALDEVVRERTRLAWWIEWLQAKASPQCGCACCQNLLKADQSDSGSDA